MYSLPSKPQMPDKIHQLTIEQVKQYHEELQAWEAQAAAAGRACRPEDIHCLIDQGQSALVAYLETSGAPAEVITLAQSLPALQQVFTSRARGNPVRKAMEWHELDNGAAAILAENAGEIHQALTGLRKAAPPAHTE